MVTDRAVHERVSNQEIMTKERKDSRLRELTSTQSFCRNAADVGCFKAHEGMTASPGWFRGQAGQSKSLQCCGDVKFWGNCDDLQILSLRQVERC